MKKEKKKRKGGVKQNVEGKGKHEKSGGGGEIK